MSNEDLHYFRRREWQERAAAKSATNLAARRIHQQLAEQYAFILHTLAAMDPVPSLRVCGAL
jgi:hypothetical protein